MRVVGQVELLDHGLAELAAMEFAVGVEPVAVRAPAQRRDHQPPALLVGRAALDGELLIHAGRLRPRSRASLADDAAN